jgi:hypothetical protein
MGSNSGSNSGGNTGPANRYKTPAKKAADKVVDFVKGGGVTGAIVTAVTKIGKSIKEDYNTRKTNEELLGSSDYQGGKTFSGNKVSIAGGNQRGNDNSNVGAATSSGMVVQAPTVTSPTTAEVSQVTSEEARDAANLLIKKRRGRGRSSTILTSAQGVQDNKGLTLGKPTLLG